jgi:uncharacterized protein (TIGR00251 family)
MNDSFIRETATGCILNVRIHPAAHTNAITAVHAETLKISLTTPPTDGKANADLIAFIADALRLPEARVAILTGAASRNKTVEIMGKSAAEVQAALLPILFC